MKERIEKLAKKAGFGVYGEIYSPNDEDSPITKNMEKFAELIVAECTQLLFAESERLYTYSSECDNMSESDDAELCAEKCMDNIQMIEEHFGVKE